MFGTVVDRAWDWLFWGAGGLAALVALAAYPWACAAGFNLVRRERDRGTWEQLLLTRMPALDLFDAKHAAALEFFRHLGLWMLVWLGASVAALLMEGHTYGAVYWTLPCAILLNHFRYSARIGTLNGLRGACGGTSLWDSLGAAPSLNPYLLHLRRVAVTLLKTIAWSIGVVFLLASFGETLFAPLGSIGAPAGVDAAAAVALTYAGILQMLLMGVAARLKVDFEGEMVRFRVLAPRLIQEGLDGRARTREGC
jgi:hypothetical protein